MTPRRALPFLVPLFGALLVACATSPTPRAPEQLVFWRVSRADGAGGSAHLLGTMHLARSTLALDPAIERALGDADQIALEVAPAELARGDLLEHVLALGQLPPEQSLAQLVSRRTLRKLERRVADGSVPFSTWLRWEPWLVSLMLANEQLASAGFKAEAGLEPQLGERAAAQRKPTRGLETAREQLERFDTLPLATQELLLRDTLDSSGRREDSLESAWRRGDLGALARAVFESPKGKHAAPFFEAIYFARNRDFAGDIAGLIEAGGRWFVALGAGHMVGAQGIPQLLAARGYRVERVAKTPPAAAPTNPPATPARQEPAP